MTEITIDDIRDEMQKATLLFDEVDRLKFWHVHQTEDYWIDDLDTLRYGVSHTWLMVAAALRKGHVLPEPYHDYGDEIYSWRMKVHGYFTNAVEVRNREIDFFRNRLRCLREELHLVEEE